MFALRLTTWQVLKLEEFQKWLVTQSVPLGLDQTRFETDLTSPEIVTLAQQAWRERTLLADGEVRQADIAVQPTGAVYVADNGGPAERARVWLYVDDGDHEPRDDRLVEDRLLGDITIDEDELHRLGQERAFRFVETTRFTMPSRMSSLFATWL